MARKLKGQQQTLSGSPSGSFSNFAPKPIQSIRAPTTADTGYEIGQLWADTSGTTMYGLSAVAAGSATWNLLGPGASDVDTLTGDSGGALSPAGGNITLAGGTNITTVGAGSTITFNLDAAITVATSVTSALYTSGAAADLLLTAPTGQDTIMKMGDNAGANKISFTDSDDAEVASIDSNGAFAMGAITFTGLLTASASATIETAGTALNLGSDNDAAAVNLGVGTTARAIGIGNSAAAHVVTIGSVTGAAQVDLLVGTGNFSLDGAATSTYTVGASTTSGTISIGGTAQTGTMTLGDSSGVNIVEIGAGEGATTVNVAGGATAAKVVNIAVGAVANLVTIGSASGAASLDLLAGTGNYTLDGAATTTYTMGASTTSGTISIGGTAQTGTMTLGDSSGVNIVEVGAGEGATTVNIAGGATAAKAVNIGAGAIDNVVIIGTATGTASVALLSGTGNIALDSTGAISLDAAAASNFTTTGAGIDIDFVSTAGRVITTSGEDAADSIYLHANAGVAETIRLHSDLGTGAASVHLESDVGGVTLTSGLASADAINFAAASGGIDMDGALEISITSSEAAATAVNIEASNAAGGITLNVGTGNANVTGGNFVLSDVATQFEMNGGAVTDFIGQATLVNGEVTVANTNIAAADRIIVTRSAINASTALGMPLTTISAGASFKLEAKDLVTPANDETGDQSTFDYVIIRQN